MTLRLLFDAGLVSIKASAIISKHCLLLISQSVNCDLRLQSFKSTIKILKSVIRI